MTDVTAHFHGGNAESVAAHGGRRDRARRRQQADAILAWMRLRERHGATVDEIEAGMGLSHQSASARVSELKVTTNLIATDRTRQTRAGRAARVLVHWVWATAAEFDAIPSTTQKSRRRPEGVKDRPLLCPHCGVAWDE